MSADTSQHEGEKQKPETNDVSRTRRVVGALVLGMGLPLLLALVLNALRPDLVAPMLDHEFGQVLVAVERLLCFAATSVYLVAALVPFRTRTPRIVLTITGCLCFSIPALLGVLFGPIVFAFMYGGQ